MENEKRESVTDSRLNWEDQYKKLNNYIKYVAAAVAPGLKSSSLGADDLYQEGLILLYNCYEKYSAKPEPEFQSLFKSSLWRKLKGMCYKKKEFVTVDVDEVFNLGTCETLDVLYERNRVSEVKDLIRKSPDALRIFEQFLQPSKEVVFEAEMDFNRKEFLKLQGLKKSSPSEVRIKPEFIRRGLKMKVGQFKEAFKLLQEAVYLVYSEDFNITKYSLA